MLIGTWAFASGGMWWKLLAFLVCAVIPSFALFALEPMIGIDIAAKPSLSVVWFVTHFIISAVFYCACVWVTCGYVALVSASPELATRNLEASTNAAQ